MPSAPFPRARAGKNRACALIFVAEKSTREKTPEGQNKKGQAVKHLKGGNTEEDKYGMGMAIPRERWRRSRLPLTCIRPVVVVVRSEQN